MLAFHTVLESEVAVIIFYNKLYINMIIIFDFHIPLNS